MYILLVHLVYCTFICTVCALQTVPVIICVAIRTFMSILGTRFTVQSCARCYNLYIDMYILLAFIEHLLGTLCLNLNYHFMLLKCIANNPN